MTIKRIWFSIAVVLFVSVSGCQQKVNDVVQFVNPLIGTGKATGSGVSGHAQGPAAWGQVIPAVSTPFGMTQWTPQTSDTENECVAPYYYSGKKIQGFRGSHWLGGSCTRDYGSFTIMPMTGYLRTFASERASVFMHESETSTPAYYSCMLESYTTFVEMTGSARCGFFRFSYLKKDKAIIWVTPNSDEGQGYLKIDPEKQEIYGYNPVYPLDAEPGQGAGFSGYFVIRYNRPFSSYGCSFQMEDHKGETEISGKPEIGAYAAFDLAENDVILAKAGTSFTSIEAARANLDSEIPHWDFESTKAQTEKIWNTTLSVIQLKGGEMEDYTTFYSALYHSLLFPRTFSDVEGTYPGFDGQQTVMKMEKGHVYYDDFLLDHTHRAQLPLVSLVAPDKYEDMMKSLVLKAEQGGKLPGLPLRNGDSPDFTGHPAITALGDAFLKGFDIGIEKAYPFMRKQALHFISLPDSVRGSFQTMGHEVESAKCSIASFVLSRVAEKYGKPEEAAALAKQAHSHLGGETPMQSLWLVSQDQSHPIDLDGHKKQVRQRLDELCDQGNYLQWNELYHAVPYLYNLVGDPEQTQKKVKNILSGEYNNFDGGIPGNDHAGQTSAWYVFSAMGFYPVSPGSGEYQLSSPLFTAVELNLDKKYYPGKRVQITCEPADTSGTFNTVRWNDKDCKFLLKQEDLRAGGELKFSNPK